MTNTVSAITFALTVYGIGAAISFFVALLIKGMAWSLHLKKMPWFLRLREFSRSLTLFKRS